MASMLRRNCATVFNMYCKLSLVKQPFWQFIGTPRGLIIQSMFVPKYESHVFVFAGRLQTFDIGLILLSCRRLNSRNKRRFNYSFTNLVVIVC
jgi:hypothetical protein